MKTVALSGNVTLDGLPFGPGNIQFLPKSSDGGSRTSYAEVKDDGTFSATTYVTGDGIIPGKYDVRVGSEADSASTDPAMMMAAVAGAAIEVTQIEVPADGLTGIEIKLTSASGSAPTGNGALLGQ